MSKEIWKPVVGFEGLYMVSSKGRVKSLDKIVKGVFRGTTSTRPIKGRILKQAIRTGGYYLVTLSDQTNGVKKNGTVHRLVAEAFLPNHDNKPYVNHKNGNKLDNRLENLEWCTAKENTDHAMENGLMSTQQGETNNLAKLKTRTVLEIRAEAAKGLSYKEVSEKFGIKRYTAYQIINRRTWKHI